MLCEAELVSFVPVNDLAGARAFYESVLGLNVLEESRFAIVCESNGTQLRLTRVEDHRPAPFTILGWQVSDIAEQLAWLRLAGVSTARYDTIEQDVDGVWTAPDGTRVAWFRDPDGNTLSIQQPPITEE